MKTDLSRIEGGDVLCISIPEAARMLGISRNLAYELVNQGKLPYIMLGERRKVIPKVLLMKMLERGYME